MLDKDQTKEAVLASFEKGTTLDQYKSDSDFRIFMFEDDIQLSEMWKEVQDLYPSYREEYLTKVDIALRDSMLVLSKLDQEFRLRRDLPDSLRRQRGLAQDKIVQAQLKELIEQRGFIDIPIIGGRDIDQKMVSISAILLHAPDEERINYWVPLIKGEIRNGRCSPYLLGSMMEQYHVYKGEKPILGLIPGSKVEDKIRANQLRAEMGLPKYEVDSLKFAQMTSGPKFIVNKKK